MDPNTSNSKSEIEPEDWEVLIEWSPPPQIAERNEGASALSLIPENDNRLSEIITSSERLGSNIHSDSSSTISATTLVPTLPTTLSDVPVKMSFVNSSHGFGSKERRKKSSGRPKGCQDALRTRYQAKQPSRKRQLAPKPGQISIVSSLEEEDGFVHYSHDGTMAKKPRTRAKLDKEKAEKYRKTREHGACARCRMRKTPCDSDPLDICTACLKLGIPLELCTRTKVKDLDTHGSTGLAMAFVNAYEKSIEEWQTKKILLDIGHGFGKPFTIEIHGFKSKRPIVDLFWKEPSGWQKLEHRPFGIMDIAHIDSGALDVYVQSQVPRILYQLDRDHFRGSTIFTDTMQVIQDYLPQCVDPIRKILQDALTLWGYMHLQYHALWQFASDSKDDDKLGMSELILYSHDVQTLTPFHGTIPLPRLLHQQIHACCEGRMKTLDKSVLVGLENMYMSFRTRRKSEPDTLKERSLGLYLATWLYLTILEELAWDAHRWVNLLPEFIWPLQARSPEEQSKYSMHAAQTIYAHYQAATDKESLWNLCALDSDTPEEASRIPGMVSRLQSSDVNIVQRKNSTYSTDIRSLELKFSAMLLEDAH